MTTASLHFWSVSEGDLDQVLNDGRVVLKQSDYSLTISMPIMSKSWAHNITIIIIVKCSMRTVNPIA